MIDAADYAFLADVLQRHSGLALGDGKEYLLESRLPSVAATFGVNDVRTLVDKLRLTGDAAMTRAVCEAMTTGETFFFRDEKPFDVLRDVLLPSAAVRARGAGRPLRIWCAAASTGQEPYSVAMIVDQLSASLGVPVEIVATDYNRQSLERAQSGSYNQFEVQRGLPAMLMVRYFEPRDGRYVVRQTLRDRIRWECRNLLDRFDDLGKFDIVLCRNVLIYFEPERKKDVMDRIGGLLHPGGSLLLGGTETTYGITEALTRRNGLACSVYARAGDTTDIALPAAA